MQNLNPLPLVEYSPDYCSFLEGTYGDNMLSEGGSEAIDRMFLDADVTNKKLLDIGAGLGGAAFYLAEKYNVPVVGIEITAWLANEAKRRTPTHLKNLVNFVSYEKPSFLPFESHCFDIVYSKGVLTHLEDKSTLFKEIYRVLKPCGLLIIADWLSPIKGQWGEALQKMCDGENLTLYAETEAGYLDLLATSGFENIVMRDENDHYAVYNHNIVERLSHPRTAKDFIAKFGEVARCQAVESYQLIRDSIMKNELLIRSFRCEKRL